MKFSSRTYTEKIRKTYGKIRQNISAIVPAVMKPAYLKVVSGKYGFRDEQCVEEVSIVALVLRGVYFSIGGHDPFGFC